MKTGKTYAQIRTTCTQQLRTCTHTHTHTHTFFFFYPSAHFMHFIPGMTKRFLVYQSNIYTRYIILTASKETLQIEINIGTKKREHIIEDCSKNILKVKFYNTINIAEQFLMSIEFIHLYLSFYSIQFLYCLSMTSASIFMFLHHASNISYFVHLDSSNLQFFIFFSLTFSNGALSLLYRFPLSLFLF